MIRKIHFFIKKFLSVKMTVEGYSMWPGIKPNDVIYAERFNILSKQPVVGNIVIVIEPTDIGTLAIKRIIAGPHDEICLVNNEISVNGHRVSDDIADISGDVGRKSWLLAGREYFLMSDNPNLSTDSRKYGPISRDSIVARVWMVRSSVYGFKRLDS